MRENSMKTVEAKELRIQDLEYLLSQYGQSEK